MAKGEPTEEPTWDVEYVADAGLEAMKARAGELGVEIEEAYILARLTNNHAVTAATGRGETPDTGDMLTALLHHAKALAGMMGLNFMVGNLDEWTRRRPSRRGGH